MSARHDHEKAERQNGWGKLRHGLMERLPFGHSHGGHGHDGGPDDALQSSDEGIRALKASLIVLLLTALFQAAIVAFSGSVALLADTIHNFGDALTAVPLWVAFALSKRAANRSYTYGYGRAEDLAGVAIVGVIFFSACVAGYQSVVKLVGGSEVSNVGWVAAAAVVGFVGNESWPGGAYPWGSASAAPRWSPTGSTPGRTASPPWPSSSAPSGCGSATPSWTRSSVSASRWRSCS